MKYTGKKPYGINQTGTGSIAVSVENVDVASFTSGSLFISGSVSASLGFTGSLLGTGSYALQALTASYAVSASHEIIKEVSSSFADTASYVNPLVQDVDITGSLTVSGSSTFTNIGPAVFSGSIDVHQNKVTILRTVDASGSLKDNLQLKVENTVEDRPSGIEFRSNRSGTSSDSGAIVYTTTTASSNTRQIHLIPEIGVSGDLSNSSLVAKGGGQVTIGNSTNPATPLEILGRGIKLEPLSGNTFTFAHSRNANIFFQVNSQTLLTLDRDGTVGIGYTDPTARLQVRGTGTTSSTTALLVENSNASASLAVLDNGNVGIGTTVPVQKLDIKDGNIRLENSRAIYFATVDANIGRVRIIGDEAGDFIQLTVDNSATHTLILNTTGVGIGTTSPATKLHISDSDPRIRLTDTDGTDYYGDVFQQGGALKIEARNGTFFGNINFQGNNGTTGLEYARFNSVGNFGINTNSPTAKLHVKGSGTTSSTKALLVENSSATASLVVNDAGNVLIGTTTDAGYKLQVEGEVSANGYWSNSQQGQTIDVPTGAGQTLHFENGILTSVM